MTGMTKSVVAFFALLLLVIAGSALLGAKLAPSHSAAAAYTAPTDPFEGVLYPMTVDTMNAVRAMAPAPGVSNSLFVNMEAENGREYRLRQGSPLPVVIMDGEAVEVLDLRYYDRHGDGPGAGDILSYQVRRGRVATLYEDPWGAEDTSVQHSVLRSLILGLLAQEERSAPVIPNK